MRGVPIALSSLILLRSVPVIRYHTYLIMSESLRADSSRRVLSSSLGGCQLIVVTIAPCNFRIKDNNNGSAVLLQPKYLLETPRLKTSPWMDK